MITLLMTSVTDSFTVGHEQESNICVGFDLVFILYFQWSKFQLHQSFNELLTKSRYIMQRI